LRGGKHLNEEKVLKRAAAYSLFLMICVVTFSVGMRFPKESISYASEITKTPMPSESPLIAKPTEVVTAEDAISNDLYSNLPFKIDNELKKRLGDNFIAIEKPQGLANDYTFSLEDLAVDRRINITIAGSKPVLIDVAKIHRIYGSNYNYGTPIVISPSPTPIPDPEVEEASYEPSIVPEYVPTDNATAIDIVYNVDDTTHKNSTLVTLDLIKTYAYQLEEDDHYFYIALLRPQDVYDTIVVLDAGHGGKDCGTYSDGFEYLEKTMNLDMILRLNEYFSNYKKIKIYTTRTTDRRLTLNQRVNLANDVEADLFLSIHCNANLESNIDGTEVLYNEKQNDWTSFNSKEFATICQEDLAANIGLRDRGIVPRSKDVFIVGEAHMPVALVEVAFMSNSTDLNFLIKESNRQLVAEGIYHGILRSLETMGKEID
jgi:N-acetylmuramoyl-L-alanine amidase